MEACFIFCFLLEFFYHLERVGGGMLRKNNELFITSRGIQIMRATARITVTHAFSVILTTIKSTSRGAQPLDYLFKQFYSSARQCIKRSHVLLFIVHCALFRSGFRRCYLLIVANYVNFSPMKFLSFYSWYSMAQKSSIIYLQYHYSLILNYTL